LASLKRRREVVNTRPGFEPRKPLCQLEYFGRAF
jgi:hypothetical protein